MKKIKEMHCEVGCRPETNTISELHPWHYAIILCKFLAGMLLVLHVYTLRNSSYSQMKVNKDAHSTEHKINVHDVTE